MKTSTESSPERDALPKRKPGKKHKLQENVNHFDRIPDDLLELIMSTLSSTAKRPFDFIGTLITCKRFVAVGMQPSVLTGASNFMFFTIQPSRWCEGCHRFLTRCADAGNMEACYTLGMIEFYCLQEWSNGAALIAKAAIAGHTRALYSMAIIRLNGSGDEEKDPEAGAALCGKAARMGHMCATREIAFSFASGFGVKRDSHEAIRLMNAAHSMEKSYRSRRGCPWRKPSLERHLQALRGCEFPGASDQCTAHLVDSDPTLKLLRAWTHVHPPALGLRACSFICCGRRETRKGEFRACEENCETVRYCSWSCLSLDWSVGHQRHVRH